MCFLSINASLKHTSSDTKQEYNSNVRKKYIYVFNKYHKIHSSSLLQKHETIKAANTVSIISKHTQNSIKTINLLQYWNNIKHNQTQSRPLHHHRTWTIRQLRETINLKSAHHTLTILHKNTINQNKVPHTYLEHQ